MFFCVPGSACRRARIRCRAPWTRVRRRSSWSDGSTSMRRRCSFHRFARRWVRCRPWRSADPATSMATVGVTGTNGKTTVTYLLASIFEAAGWTAGRGGDDRRQRRGRAGPARAHDAGGAGPASAPGADARPRRSGRRDGGVLARARPAPCRRRACSTSRSSRTCRRTTWTSTATMDAYFDAKARLFTAGHAARAIVNVDDAFGRPAGRGSRDPGDDVRGRTRGPTCGRATSSSLATASRSRIDGIAGPVSAARALQRGEPAGRRGGGAGAGHRRRARSSAGIAALRDVPGRMEPVEAGQDFLVVVDYAHTPDSIRSVLRASRPLTSGRLILVFGCGGDRDRAKRSPMGAAATANADLTVVTTDNPRSEDPLAIIAEIEPGRERGRRRVRRRARPAGGDPAGASRGRPRATWSSSPGRVTSRSRSSRDEAVPFDDRVVAREELEAHGERRDEAAADVGGRAGRRGARSSARTSR